MVRIVNKYWDIAKNLGSWEDKIVHGENPKILGWGGGQALMGENNPLMRGGPPPSTPILDSPDPSVIEDFEQLSLNGGGDGAGGKLEKSGAELKLKLSFTCRLLC